VKHIGQLIQQRREAMGLTQAALSREMGGYPSASLMSRIEVGEVMLTPSSAAKYAEVLRLDKDVFHNAAGFATPAQHADAITRLEQSLGEDVPVMVAVPVINPEYPDLMAANPHRTRELKKAEDVFLVDLAGTRNAPYLGEVLASRARKPKDGQGVVAEVSGKLGAWTWHTARTTGDWIENGAGERVTKFRLWGVILRYVTAFEME
jgi:transcriptional regulator with XRE-family HTH domain